MGVRGGRRYPLVRGGHRRHQGPGAAPHIRARAINARKIGRRWLIHGDVLDAFTRGGDDPNVMAHPETRKDRT